MFLDLSVPWIVALNVGLWPLIQLGLAWVFLRLPERWFEPPSRTWSGESAARYERLFRIKSWKDRLPDGAAWLGGGFAKKRLAGADPAYLHRFLRETRRGELCHLSAFLFVPPFALWNPWWGMVVIVLYALAANLPCVLVQRYNRLRLQGLLVRQLRSSR